MQVKKTYNTVSSTTNVTLDIVDKGLCDLLVTASNGTDAQFVYELHNFLTSLGVGFTYQMPQYPGMQSNVPGYQYNNIRDFQSPSRDQDDRVEAAFAVTGIHAMLNQLIGVAILHNEFILNLKSLEGNVHGEMVCPRIIISREYLPRGPVGADFSVSKISERYGLKGTSGPGYSKSEYVFFHQNYIYFFGFGV